jgi:uncharacterized protein YcbK (DUF882 family)
MKNRMPNNPKGKNLNLIFSSHFTGDCCLSRRRLLKIGLWTAASVASSFSPRTSFGGILDALPQERILSFYNTHTGETLKAIYCHSGNYVADAVEKICNILRDHRTNTVRSIDLSLFDLLYALQLKLQTNQPFHIISGYRSPATNTELRKQNRKVVPNSLHISGKAIDIRLPDCDLHTLRNTALALHGGGVGYYPKSDFVHLDVGPVRSW